MAQACQVAILPPLSLPDFAPNGFLQQACFPPLVLKHAACRLDINTLSFLYNVSSCIASGNVGGSP